MLDLFNRIKYIRVLFSVHWTANISEFIKQKKKKTANFFRARHIGISVTWLDLIFLQILILLVGVLCKVKVAWSAKSTWWWLEEGIEIELISFMETNIYLYLDVCMCVCVRVCARFCFSERDFIKEVPVKKDVPQMLILTSASLKDIITWSV